MGSKLFPILRDAAKRPEQQPWDAVDKEAGTSLESRMRQLMTRDYSPEQLQALKSLYGQEGAARFETEPVRVQEVMAPVADMLKLISEQSGLRLINLSKYPKADKRLLAMVPEQIAKDYQLVPVEETDDGRLVIAIGDPSNPMKIDEVRMVLDCDIEAVVADEKEINDRIEAYYGMPESLEKILEIAGQDSENDDDPLAMKEGTHDISQAGLAEASPIKKLVDILLMKAISDRASDIHIEPFPAFLRVRYRVDGVLRELPSPPRNQLDAIISRLKVMTGTMNISEKRLPQDGRIKLVVEGREIDMRVSSVPTVHGESIVMRVLDKTMMMIGIGKIGMLKDVLDRFKKYISKPNGIVLVTGPTGSGKTTTLYAALSEVKDPGEKLITTEDPVEYELDGIQQVSINDNVGLTFARCLRAILRQDPDKVLVGEVRDVETAQISVQAALTGHLVFATLHTNSAAATVTRLLDMGVEPFLITSSMEAIIGQRLLRTLCQQCKVPYTPVDEELSEFGVTLRDVQEQGIIFYRGEGCNECNHTGYRGRIGIYELLEVTDEIRELILERATTDEIQEMALRQGMITMRKDGWIKICMGITTLEEVARQTPRDAEPVMDDDATVLAQEEKDNITEAMMEHQAIQNESLMKPKPKLNASTMIVENEAAMPAYKAGDAQASEKK